MRINVFAVDDELCPAVNMCAWVPKPSSTKGPLPHNVPIVWESEGSQRRARTPAAVPWCQRVS